MRFIDSHLYIAFSIALASLCAFAPPAVATTKDAALKAPAPEVLVTIKPIYSLVAGVMRGIGEPKLLIKNTQSIHHYSLRPSDRRVISNADLIFWVGESLETFLTPILKNELTSSQSISLITANEIHSLHADSHDKEHSHHTVDPHIWLSTHNAAVMVKEITKQLVLIDPTRSTQYLINRDRLLKKITQLKKNIGNQLREITKPYLILHNGIRYFEKEFNLNHIASIQKNTDLQPGASHIHYLLQLIRNNNVNCLFYNQSEKSPIIDSIKSATNIKTISIDPVGTNIESSEDTWFNIMNQLSKKLSACLK